MIDGGPGPPHALECGARTALGQVARRWRDHRPSRSPGSEGMLGMREMIAMPRTTPKCDRLVLLVEPDAGEREEFGSWLEAAGYGVINCPGPPGAGMVCLGQRGR